MLVNDAYAIKEDREREWGEILSTMSSNWIAYNIIKCSFSKSQVNSLTCVNLHL